MMSDQYLSPSAFKPTQYWLNYQDRFVRELQWYGLKDFRRRDHIGLAKSKMPTFGACDWAPALAPHDWLLGWRGAGALDFAMKIASKYSIQKLYQPSNHFHHPQRSYTGYFYSVLAARFEKSGLRLIDCAMSLVGNPEDVFMVEGRAFSLMYLTYCWMFMDVWQRVSGLLEDNFVYAEIGSGMGRNAEIVGKLFPESTIVCFDIAPQLYVAHQYLKAVFGERVIDYGSAVSLAPEKLRKGSIVLLPAWLLDRWTSLKIDLFWNSASFQEMEPDLVRNYIAAVKAMRPQIAYVNALPSGNYTEGSRYSTRERVTAALYRECFAPELSLSDEFGTNYLLASYGEYRSYLFRAAAN